MNDFFFGEGMRGKLTLIVLALFALIFAGCDQTPKSNTIKIAVISPFSGDLASYGISVRNAVRLAVEKINKKGGINGKKIELLEEDDVCDANTAADVANKVVSAGVKIVIGHLCSGATKAALPIYKQAKVIVISPASTTPDLTLKGGNPNFFRTIAHDAAQASLQVNFIVNKLKGKRVAVIHDKGSYGKGLATLVRNQLKAKGKEVVLFEGVTAGAMSYTSLILKIKQANVDTIAFGGYHPEASKIVKEAKEKGIVANFISGDGVKDPSFLKIAGSFAEGYYTSAPTDTKTLPMAKLVVKEYKEKFKKDIGTFTLQAYAAVNVIANAIQRTKSTDYIKLVNALRTESVSTPLGRISFDKNGDVIGAGFTMYQVKNGEFQATQK
ncbi:MAG: branched-chain amino acid transport system substrate-binding protein [bacterium]